MAKPLVPKTRGTPPRGTEEFEGPSLYFKKAKEKLGLPQVPFEHIVIPFSSQTIEKQATEQARKNLLRRLFPRKSGFSLVSTNKDYKHDLHLGELLGFVYGPELYPYVKHVVGYELKNEKYRPIEKLEQKLSRMTHCVVDNEGNIILMRNPALDAAKAITFKERAEHLKKLFLWNHPYQRRMFEFTPNNAPPKDKEPLPRERKTAQARFKRAA